MPKKKKQDNTPLVERLEKWGKKPWVDKMLDDGESPNVVAKWCNENGLKCSVPAMYKYAKQRRDGIIQKAMAEKAVPPVDIEVLRAKKAQKEKGAKGVHGGHSGNGGHGGHVGAGSGGARAQGDASAENSERARERRKAKNNRVPKVKTDLEMLDAIIQKGMETLLLMEAVAPQVAIKAIELKHKITGGAHSGITTYGLEEIRLREAARENAMVAILLEYVPEDKREEVIERMEQITREYYESIGLGEAYRASLEEEEEEQTAVAGGEE